MFNDMLHESKIIKATEGKNVKRLEIDKKHAKEGLFYSHTRDDKH